MLEYYFIVLKYRTSSNSNSQQKNIKSIKASKSSITADKFMKMIQPPLRISNKSENNKVSFLIKQIGQISKLLIILSLGQGLGNLVGILK